MSIQERAEAECRLYALEWYVCMLHAAIFAQAGKDGLVILGHLRQTALEGARQKAFPGLDPAMSDLVSAELEAAVDRLLSMTAGFLAKAPSGT